MAVYNTKSALIQSIVDNLQPLIKEGELENKLIDIVDTVYSEINNLSSGDNTQANLAWDSGTVYNTTDNQFAVYQERLYESKQDNNIGNEPPTTPNSNGDFEDAWWKEVSAAPTASIPDYENGTYTGDPVIVHKDDKLYRLTADTPYESTNFANELAAGDWVTIGHSLEDARNVDNTMLGDIKFGDLASIIGPFDPGQHIKFYKNSTKIGFSIIDDGPVVYEPLVIEKQKVRIWGGELNIGGDNFIVTVGNGNIHTKGNLQFGTSKIVNKILDEDDLASDDDLALATQQSIKAYVDANAGGNETLEQTRVLGNSFSGPVNFTGGGVYYTWDYSAWIRSKNDAGTAGRIIGASTGSGYPTDTLFIGDIDAIYDKVVLQGGNVDAIEIDNNGNVFTNNLPTQDPNVAGQWWINNGSLAVSSG